MITMFTFIISYPLKFNARYIIDRLIIMLLRAHVSFTLKLMILDLTHVNYEGIESCLCMCKFIVIGYRIRCWGVFMLILEFGT